MNAEQFLSDHRLPIAGPGDRHYAQGWIHTPCPFCSGRTAGNHLGHDGKEPWLCWRCGPHSSIEVIRRFLGITQGQAARILQRYTTTRSREITEKQHVHARSVVFPRNIKPLSLRHLDYLQSRGFNDPKQIEHEWGLLGTDQLSNRPWRIIAPVTHDGKQVSWISRDITGRAKLRYLPCVKEHETRPHKECLYGIEKLHMSWNRAILVEGIIDAWKIGPGAVASFGQKLTSTQALLFIRKGLKKVGVFLDPDARASSQVLCSLLGAMGIESVEILADTDPGDMSESDAKDVRAMFF